MRDGREVFLGHLTARTGWDANGAARGLVVKGEQLQVVTSIIETFRVDLCSIYRFTGKLTFPKPTLPPFPFEAERLR